MNKIQNLIRTDDGDVDCCWLNQEALLTLIIPIGKGKYILNVLLYEISVQSHSLYGIGHSSLNGWAIKGGGGRPGH